MNLPLNSVIIRCDDDNDLISVLSFAEELSTCASRWQRLESNDICLPSLPRRKASSIGLPSLPRRKASIPEIMVFSREYGNGTSARNADWTSSSSKPRRKLRSRKTEPTPANLSWWSASSPPTLPLRRRSATGLRPTEWQQRQQS